MSRPARVEDVAVGPGSQQNRERGPPSGPASSACPGRDRSHGLPCRDADPVSVYERKEEQAFVHRALAAVSQVVSDCSYRVLLLRSIDELDVSEVAAALGLTPEQVRYRHCRASGNCVDWSRP